MADSTHSTTSEHGTADDDAAKQFFDESTRRELAEEDRVAWRNVCGVLFSIVFGGVLLGLLGVLLCAYN